MSHFTVAIFTEGTPDIEAMLAPFDENKEVEPYVEYTKEALIQKYREEIEELKKGAYATYLEDKKKYSVDSQEFKDIYSPARVKFFEEEVPQRFTWTDEEVYQHALKFYEPETVQEDGSIISTYNPNSKWDWYAVGGRWEGSMTDKHGYSINSGFANEISFEPRAEDVEYYSNIWDIVNNAKPVTPEDELRARYYKSQIKGFASKEDYVKEMCRFQTYAYITPDGEWVEPGEMGWFGCSSTTEDSQKEYDVLFKKMLDEAIKNNYHIVVVDCHI